MGLLDHYRQFEGLEPEEVNAELRRRAAERRRLALAVVPELDLSNTEWPHFPNSEVVNAAIATARGRINGYPDGRSTQLREALSRRHGVEPDQIAVGNGAAELLQSAAFVLLQPGEELLVPWPSYILFPVLAYRAGAEPRLVALDDGGGVSVEALLDAVGERTRAIVLCNPNDPTGTYLPAAEVRRLLEGLPDHVHLLVDEAFVQFQDHEPEEAVLSLVADFDRLVVFRTFSKIYGLSGLRIGYAIASADGAEMLRAISPALGVNALSEAAARQALKIGDAEVQRRRASVVEQRARLREARRDLPLEGPVSHANFVWLRSPGANGLEIAARLRRSSVIVAAGEALGDPDHVRIAIRDEADMDRLLSALARAFPGG